LDRLHHYRVVILPSILYLSRAQERALESWAAAGGRLLVPGERPRFYENGKERPALAFAGASTDLAPAYAAEGQWTARDDLPGLRATVYWKKEGRRVTLVTHLLNYDVSKKGEVRPARSVRVSYPLPDGAARAGRAQVWLVSPESGEGTAIDAELRDSRLTFEIAEVGIYQLVEASLS
ncbi:MAG: hypothetical protein U0Q18_37700, partial [Bryobacteraceae bacterium]